MRHIYSWSTQTYAKQTNTSYTQSTKVQCFLNDVIHIRWKGRKYFTSMTKRTQASSTVLCHFVYGVGWFFLFSPSPVLLFHLFRKKIWTTFIPVFIWNLSLYEFLALLASVYLEMKMFWEKLWFHKRSSKNCKHDIWFSLRSLRMCVLINNIDRFASDFRWLFAVYGCCYPLGSFSIYCETILSFDIASENHNLTDIALSEIESESESERGKGEKHNIPIEHKHIFLCDRGAHILSIWICFSLLFHWKNVILGAYWLFNRVPYAPIE